MGRLKSVGQEREISGLFAIDLEDQTVTPLAKGKAIGNLDGIEAVKPGTYRVTDWADGALYKITTEGKVDRLIDLNQGSADLTYLADKRDGADSGDARQHAGCLQAGGVRFKRAKEEEKEIATPSNCLDER